MLFKVKNIHGNKIMLFNLFINCYLFHARFKTSQTPEIRILIATFWPYLHLLIQNETPYGHYRTRNNIAGKWNIYDNCRPKNMRLHNGCTFVRRIANPPIRFSWHCYGKCTTLTTPHADCKSSRTQRIYSYPTHVKYFALKLRMNPTLTLPEYPWRERNILPVWKNTFFSVKRNALADRTLRQPMQQNETYGKTKGHLLQAEIRSFSL